MLAAISIAVVLSALFGTEIHLFKRCLAEARHYFEFGAGGSTVMVAHAANIKSAVVVGANQDGWPSCRSRGKYPSVSSAVNCATPTLMSYGLSASDTIPNLSTMG
jgi:hypothetical protein